MLFTLQTMGFLKIFSPIKDNVIFRISTILAFCVNIMVWIFVFLYFRPYDELIPLHYNIYFGIDNYGRWNNIFFLPLSGTVIFFINVIFASLVYRKEQILGYFLILSSFLLELILFLSIFLLRRFT